MHRFWGHFFDLTIITLGTSNFDLTPGIWGIKIFLCKERYLSLLTILSI